MSRYFFSLSVPLNTPGVFSREVESADPVDLARRVNAALDGLRSDAGLTGILIVCNLSGCGFGPSYRVELVAIDAEIPAVIPSTVPLAANPDSILRAACYKAASAGPQDVAPNNQLLLARARLLAEINTPPAVVAAPVWDELQAGAADGLSVMGLVLYNETIQTPQ